MEIKLKDKWTKNAKRYETHKASGAHSGGVGAAGRRSKRMHVPFSKGKGQGERRG